MRRADAEFPRLAPEELARLAGEVADQYAVSYTHLDVYKRQGQAIRRVFVSNVKKEAAHDEA